MSGNHAAIYNAIRNAGNGNMLQIMMEVGGSNPTTLGSNFYWVQSDYAVMTNIAWEIHC